MKIYSDYLTCSDLENACNRPAYYAEVEEIHNPRVRSRGWTVRLAGSSNRWRNSGIRGSETVRAASWDQHGEWIARLFLLDPDARIGPYDRINSFQYNPQTSHYLEQVEEAASRAHDLVLSDGTRYSGTVQYDEDGQVKFDWATCEHCGFRWNDALITQLTPAPSGRCPNEYNHEYEEDD